jgi:hypothetical protein
MRDDENMPDLPWSDEEEYVAYLQLERHMFAWVLQHEGKTPRAAAESLALRVYRYEPAGSERGLIFHDEAWHWAMLSLHGQLYWKAKPALERPSETYREESRRFQEETGRRLS